MPSFSESKPWHWLWWQLTQVEVTRHQMQWDDVYYLSNNRGEVAVCMSLVGVILPHLKPVAGQLALETNKKWEPRAFFYLVDDPLGKDRQSDKYEVMWKRGHVMKLRHIVTANYGLMRIYRTLPQGVP